jgi:hypothetical protein
MKYNQFLIEIPKSLDSEFCQHAIEKFESDERKSPGLCFRGLDLDTKRSTDLAISGLSEWTEEDKIFFNSLKENLMSYAKILDFCDKPVNFPSDTGYQIQRTRPGEFYKWHNDSHIHSDKKERILTYIWYLNDIDEGGETEFATGEKIKPEVGKLLLFPATWTYVHRGIPPVKQTKYIATGWILSTYSLN